MTLRRWMLFLAAAGLMLGSLDSARADSTTEEKATPVPPDAEIAKKDKYPEHKDIKLPLSEGEKLTYAIKWGAVDAGQAVLKVKRKEQLGPGGPEVWNVQLKTRSNAFVSMFYEVRDDIKTLIDVEGGFTRLFDMRKNEGHYHAAERIEFDDEAREAKYVKTRYRALGAKKRTKMIELPGRVQDPLSCLYYARGLDLEVGSKHRMTVNTSKKNWVLTLNVLREEKKEIKGLGEVQCLVIEPEAQFQGIFVRKGKMTIWLEKRTRVPLLMKVDIPIGSASAILTKAENSPLSKYAPTSAGKK